MWDDHADGAWSAGCWGKTNSWSIQHYSLPAEALHLASLDSFEPCGRIRNRCSSSQKRLLTLSQRYRR